MPQRFVFVFTPTHGSWLNLIENQFSKMTRTMLRGIRVASKQELIDRIHLSFEEINAEPVIFRWKYKMDETFIVSFLENDDLVRTVRSLSRPACSKIAFRGLNHGRQALAADRGAVPRRTRARAGVSAGVSRWRLRQRWRITAGSGVAAGSKQASRKLPGIARTGNRNAHCCA